VYWNSSPRPVSLYLADPPCGNTQRDVGVLSCNVPPVSRLELGGNRVGVYALRPLQRLLITWSYTPLEVTLDVAGACGCPESGVLSDEERARYLRSSVQVPLGPDIVAAAHALRGEEMEVLGIARRFFDDLRTRGQYLYPVKDRGAGRMQQTWRGDCGQFSLLFVAYCRACGIPARVVMGTFTSVAQMSPHVWAEFWLDGAGWVPVDVSIGEALTHRATPGSPDPGVVFGHLKPIRFAFSTDVDLPAQDRNAGDLLPAAARRPHRNRWRTVRFEGRPLVWGGEALCGNVPYLQPAYPTFGDLPFLGGAFRPSLIGHWLPGSGDVRLLPLLAFREFSPLPLIVLSVLLILAHDFLSGRAAQVLVTLASLVAALRVGQALTRGFEASLVRAQRYTFWSYVGMLALWTVLCFFGVREVFHLI